MAATLPAHALVLIAARVDLQVEIALRHKALLSTHGLRRLHPAADAEWRGST
jgi:hypothetical protein